MSIDIDALRADYRVVRTWWLKHNGWEAVDIAEADAAIANDVKRNDQALLECWKNYFREIIQQIPANQLETNREVRQ